MPNPTQTVSVSPNSLEISLLCFEQAISHLDEALSGNLEPEAVIRSLRIAKELVRDGRGPLQSQLDHFKASLHA